MHLGPVYPPGHFRELGKSYGQKREFMRKLLLITILTAASILGVAQSGPVSASFSDAASESGSTTLVVVPIVPSTFQLSKGEKFRRFVSQSTDPGNFLGAGI